MPVRNVHERQIPGSAEEVGALLDTLGSRDDLFWPSEHWPRMVLRPRLEAGANGGHGPIRYTVTAYEPGRRVAFRFTGPRGFDGTHVFELLADDGGVRLRHVLEIALHGRARIVWPLALRPLHDALLEDAMDKAAVRFGGVPTARWSRYVRLLRWSMRD